jgi:hypothetical protein
VRREENRRKGKRGRKRKRGEDEKALDKTA